MIDLEDKQGKEIKLGRKNIVLFKTVSFRRYTPPPASEKIFKLSPEGNCLPLSYKVPGCNFCILSIFEGDILPAMQDLKIYW